MGEHRRLFEVTKAGTSAALTGNIVPYYRLNSEIAGQAKGHKALFELFGAVLLTPETSPFKGDGGGQ